MVNTLKIAFDKYFTTLRLVGSVPILETRVLSILTFLRRYVYSQATIIEEKELKAIEEIFNCISSSSCLINDFPQLIKNTGANHGNMFTQGGMTIISNSTGENLSTQQGNVQKFSDFAYQPSLGSEDFLAGYDSTLNENIRVNAGALISTWQPI